MVLSLAGTVIGDRYTVERELGRGGMATVWLARDRQHDRDVAIKVIHPDLAGSIGLSRFVREVRLTARLQHPNIVPTLDSGVLTAPDGSSLPWYAMPYLAGESLRGRLVRERQLPVDEALRITRSVAEGLQAAHIQGFIHRDIKPENVFISEGRVYLVDFGIAKALFEDGGESLTRTGMAIGTAAYMSPEQATAERIDARTDQYSLAVVLYEMLVGEPPFTGPTAQAIVARQLTEHPRMIRSVRPSVPEPVERAVLRALERIPADRFPDLNGFTTALEGGATLHGVSRAPQGGYRHAVIALILLVLTALGAWRLAASRRVAPSRPSNPEVISLYQRGLKAYQTRTPDGVREAVEDFRGAIARDSSFAGAWAALAKAYIRAEERQFAVPGLSPDRMLSEAVKTVGRSLLLDSSSADAWLTQGILGQRIDPTDLAPALRAVRRSIALDSSRAEAWHFLARFTAESGDLTGALDAWRRSVKLGPTYTQGLAFFALGYYWHGQYDSARIWADSAVALEPNYLLGRTTVGQIATEQRDFPHAIAAFEAARRVSSDIESVNVLAGRIVAEARAGRRAEALATLRRADSLAEKYSPVSLHLAVYVAEAHSAVGEVAQALAWLRRYSQPDDLHFQLHLRCDPAVAPIAEIPAFKALLTRPAPAAGQGC